MPPSKKVFLVCGKISDGEYLAFAQSLKSVKIGGSITVIGFVGGPVAGAGFLVRPPPPVVPSSVL